MGFFFRKSVGFGPFRLNFSKSGVGVSAGVRGARVSTGPSGTYVHGGSHGFYYRQKISGGTRSSQSQPRNFVPTSHSSYDSGVIESADVERFQDTSSSTLLKEINERSSQFRVAPWLGIGTFIAAFGIVGIWNSLGALLALLPQVLLIGSWLIGLIIVVLGLLLTWDIHKSDNLKRTTPLFYELEGDTSAKFEQRTRAIRTLGSTQRLWRIQTQNETWDWKRNAGASSLISRTPANVSASQPPFIATNVEVWCLTLNDQTLYFMPDYIFVRQRGVYGAITYDAFQADFEFTRFIEDQGVPSDSQVLDYTWQFVNKKGGPDRRFSNNRQIPVVQYGFVQLRTSSGLNIHLHVSNTRIAKTFCDLIGKNPSHRTSHSGSRVSSNDSRTLNKTVKDAFDNLGIAHTATSTEIVSAFRQMAKMYHPDRLSHLAPEFVQMAESRMKEINHAYGVLKQNGFA